MAIDFSRLSPAAQAQIVRKLTHENLKRSAEAGAAKQDGRMMPGESKYHNQKDRRGALTFDSRKEARRFDELLLLLKTGAIRALKLQKQYTLQESYITPEGERIRAIRYVADFTYFDCAKQCEVVEDVKSCATRTEKYKIKKKLMQERFGITITEV